MKLSTGKEPFKIEFDNGDEETIYINPNDTDLAVRMIKFRDVCKQRMKELEDVKINPDGTADEAEETANIMQQYRDILCEELDKAFNSKISDKVFKYCSPFSTVNGELYALIALEQLGEEIKQRAEKNAEKTQKAMEKYTKKYKL